VNRAYDSCITNHPGTTIHNIPSVNTPLHLNYFPANTKAGFQVSGLYLFSGNIFQNEEVMDAYVPDRAAPPTEAAASNSNSDVTAILMILPNNHNLLLK
jgi:hypothetical protein